MPLQLYSHFLTLLARLFCERIADQKKKQEAICRQHAEKMQEKMRQSHLESAVLTDQEPAHSDPGPSMTSVEQEGTSVFEDSQQEQEGPGSDTESESERPRQGSHDSEEGEEDFDDMAAHKSFDNFIVSLTRVMRKTLSVLLMN